MSKIMVLGAGSFGIALSILANENNDVVLWTHTKESESLLKKTRCNEKVLSGVFIDEDIKITSDISLVKDMDVVIIATPSYAVKETALKMNDYINKNTVIVKASKGIEKESLTMLSDIVKNIFKDNNIAILSGPSHAEEMAKKMHTTLVCACEDENISKMVQTILSTNYMRIYSSTDVIGVELGGSLKNIIAISCGVLDGLGFGDNAKAAIMTRGLKEITRLGVKMGGKSETFYGLSGMGDLIVTCTSTHSRNRRAGILIGKGYTSEEAVNKVGTVEGYYATYTAYKLAEKYGIEMPITECLYETLFNGKCVNEVLKKIISRPHKNESEFDFLNH